MRSDDDNKLRMRLKEALDNLWSRAKGRFSAVENQIETITTEVGDAVKSISMNGVNVPKDAQGNVALTEADPTVPAWAKAAGKPVYTAQEVGAIPTTAKGISGGVAELDSGGKVPSSQLPSYVDDVLAYSSRSAFPSTGETGKIYVANNTNLTYRWSGSDYVEISPSIALGETSSTAYRGDRGKAAYDHAQARGSAFASGLYLIQTNAEGHVTGATAVQKSDITALGIPATDTNTTYTLTQDVTDGHKLTFTGSDGSSITITIPDNNTTYSFTDNDPTLAWGTRSKVGTTGGTDLHVTMPNMPSAQDVGALPDSTTIPTNTSQLRNDSGFLTQHQDISGKKDTQSPVADPVASGNAISFIATISQDAQGVITPKKKTVPGASTTADGLMSAADKAKLDVLDMLGFYIDQQGYICQRIRGDA